MDIHMPFRMHIVSLAHTAAALPWQKELAPYALIRC